MTTFAPGFCFSGTTLDGVTRLVVNVCGHDSVGGPLAKNMSPVDEKYIDERGIDNLIIPISVSQPIKLKATEEYAYRVDVVVHTSLTRRCVQHHHMFQHLIAKLTELAVDWVKQECGMSIIPSSCNFIGLRFYGNTSSKSGDNLPADMLKMADEVLKAMEGAAATQESQSEDPAPPIPSGLKLDSQDTAKSTRPLIQEVVANPGIKKGFLLGEKTRLYGEKGSTEGEGKQMDPLGHIPASIREKCKVIDLREVEKKATKDTIAASTAAASPIKTNGSSARQTETVLPSLPPVNWELSSVDTTDVCSVVRVVSRRPVRSVADVELAVIGREIHVDDFRHTLPHEVDEDAVKAKFVKSSSTLVLTCPVSQHS